jgi:GGDEF domain-containing protein
MYRVEESIALLLPALRNALLYQQALSAARQDPVTGLGNRMALDECLARELELHHRHGDPLALVMLEPKRLCTPSRICSRH